MLNSELRYRIVRAVQNYPKVKSFGQQTERAIERAFYSLAQRHEGLIRPQPQLLMIAVTAYCNSRCIGCRYGRDFMPGEQLPFDVVRDVLDDAKETGYKTVRIYGGEPLLHPQIADIVEHGTKLGLDLYITTNAVTLGHRIDELYDRGLRKITVGFYGVGEAYDWYAGRKGAFDRVERGIARTRERGGDQFYLQMNWLLMRPSCTVEAFRKALEFAERYDMKMQIDLVHYSLPYFQEGPDRMLQFRPEDRPQIEEVVDEILRAKAADPRRFIQSEEGLRSTPDWLIKGPDMKVPCMAHEMLWVGADGTVQLCYVTFKLGNVHHTRLRDLINTEEHKCAARDAFALRCPNCHCGANERVLRHNDSWQRYRLARSPQRA